MSRPSMLLSQLGHFAPFPGLDLGEDALASGYGRMNGAVSGAVADPMSALPYRRHSLHRAAATAPTHAADVPAIGANYHPTIASGAVAAAGTYKTQRSSAALAAARSVSSSSCGPPPSVTVAYTAAHLQELQRRDVARKRRLRDLREQQAERARKLSRTNPAVRAFGGMAGNAAGSFGPSEDEIAELQKLSAEYVPDISGPLVSERISTSAIAAEYARADPVYQAKTASLPQTYSFYRTCKGDGHCGWRAIGFCYFETLLYLNNKQKYLEEETRLRSLSNLLQAVGLSRDIFEDWEEEVLDLLRATANVSTTGEGEATLLAAFNEGGSWQSIITYLKLLTSAWIRTRRDDYEPFMQGMTADEYVSRNIDPSQCEIEHLGLNALSEVLLKSAGFALEVLYLDRSAGTDLFPHRFEPLDQTGTAIPNAPTIRLLYRPGHYDILYAFNDAPVLAQSAPPSTTTTNGMQQPNGNVFVALASPTEDSPHGLQATPSSYMSFADNMPMIPGMSGISAPGISGTESLWMSPPPGMTTQFPPTPSYEYVPQAIQAQPAPPLPSPSTAPTPQSRSVAAHLNQNYAVATPSTYGISMSLPPTYIDDHPILTPDSQVATTSTPSVQVGTIDRNGSVGGNSGVFRHSRWEYEPRWSEATIGGPTVAGRDLGFQTSIFRNSHFNVAHFNNPDFQPEEWTPGSDPCERGRRKSTVQ